MSQLPPDLLRGLTTPRASRQLSRRRVLQAGGLASLGALLEACGIPAPPKSDLGRSAPKSHIEAFWSRQRKQGTLDFANWPLYIDVGSSPSDHPSLDLFKKRYGITVNYSEPIQEDDTFFGTIEPELASGSGTGYDLMVITNGIYLNLLIELDFLIPLDQQRMSNFYRYASDLVRNPTFDRGNRYTMAWQSGITGIGYNIDKVGHEITSWNDLLDPKLAGKIGMFGDTEDLPNSALCAIGVKPETSTPADWRRAAAWLHKQRPLVRRYYQQDYVGPFTRGDLWATMAWSGDVYQSVSTNPNLRFVVPKEGAPLWTDNMCIPAHASHPLDAMLYADFVYQPKIAAMLADYINYITPVPATAKIFANEAAHAKDKADRQYYRTLSTSPLIFPSPSDYKLLHRYRVLTQEEQIVWNGLFEPIYQA
jgi:spermidine/putrescine transport system substrate-binding protein